MKSLSNLTYSLVEDCLSKNNKIEAKLLINWEKIANEYSKITFPKEKLRRVLHLRRNLEQKDFK